MTPDSLRVYMQDQPLLPPPALEMDRLLHSPVVVALQRTLSELLLYQGMRLVGADAERAEVQSLWSALQATPIMHALRHLASGYLTGFALLEVVYDAQQMPVQYRAVPLERIGVQLDAYGMVVGFEVQLPAGKQPLSLERALYFAPYGRIDTPFGDAPLRHARKAIEAYDKVCEYLALYLKRHSVPTIIGKASPSLTAAERQTLAKRLEDLQNASYAIILGDQSIELIEPRGGSVEFALAYLQHLERLIARVILGPILAVYEAEYGTRAQAQTHLDVLRSVIAGLQAPLESAVHTQLWARLMQAQLGVRYDARLELREPESLPEQSLRMLADFALAGLVSATDVQAILKRYYQL